MNATNVKWRAAKLRMDHHRENEITFSHSLNHLKGTRTENSGGQKVDMWYRQTLCFRKIDCQWKSAHHHESVPFYMDGSGKAASDSKS